MRVLRLLIAALIAGAVIAFVVRMLAPRRGIDDLIDLDELATEYVPPVPADDVTVTVETEALIEALIEAED